MQCIHILMIRIQNCSTYYKLVCTSTLIVVSTMYIWTSRFGENQIHLCRKRIRVSPLSQYTVMVINFEERLQSSESDTSWGKYGRPGGSPTGRPGPSHTEWPWVTISTSSTNSDCPASDVPHCTGRGLQCGRLTVTALEWTRRNRLSDCRLTTSSYSDWPGTATSSSTSTATTTTSSTSVFVLTGKKWAIYWLIS
jgi:hypothetical protein